MYRIFNGVVLEFGINSLSEVFPCLPSVKITVAQKRREKKISFLLSRKDRWSRLKLPSVKYAVDDKSMIGGYKPSQ